MLVLGKKALGGEKLQTYLLNKKYKANCFPQNRIYFDSYSTYTSFFNEELLEDIRQIYKMLLGYTDTGTSNTNWVGNYVSVEAWIDVSGITNIFRKPSFKKIGYHIIYDSDDGYYLVTNSNTCIATKFIEDDNELTYVEATKEGVIFLDGYTEL